MRRWVGEIQARELYGEFEEALAWSFHFWLHRGAMELETNNLDRADVFLHTAKGIDPGDVFVDNELAYLSFKKAIANPLDGASATLVDDAVAMLNDIATRRPDQMAHAFHILGRQGLIWSQVGIVDSGRKRDFLEYLLSRARSAAAQEPSEMTRELCDQIQRALLSLAV
jgi:hypothetical protein